MSGQDMRKLMEQAVSETTSRDNVELRKKMDKLPSSNKMLLNTMRAAPDDEKLELIYKWIKTDLINFNQFEELVLDVMGSGAEKAIHR